MEKGFKENINVWFGIFVLAIAPLIIRTAGVLASPGEYQLTGLKLFTDNFYYVKGIVLATVTIGVCLYLLSDALTKGKRLLVDKTVVMVLIMGALVILSWVLSDDKTVAFRGVEDRYEGTVIWLTYLLIFMMGYTGRLTESSFRKILFPTALSSMIVSAIGIFQHFGLNLMNTALFKGIVLPEKYSYVTQSLFKDFGNMTYSLLGNSNYVGTYASLLIPLLTYGVVAEKKMVKRVIYGTALLMGIVFLAASESEAGFFAMSLVWGSILGYGMVSKRQALLGLAILSPAILWAFMFIRHMNGLSIPAAGYIGLYLFGAIVAFVVLNKEIKSVFKKLLAGVVIIGIVFAAYIGTHYQSASWSDRIFWDSMTVAPHAITAHIQKGQQESVDFECRYNSGDIIFSAGDFNQVITSEQLSQSVQRVDMEKEIGSSILVGRTKGGFIKIDVSPQNLRFGFLQDHFTVFSSGGFETKIYKTESVYPLFKDESLGNGRAYIWNRTFPLMLDHMLIGAGADTFYRQFPNDDLLGKAVALNGANHNVSKPHNMYMLAWVNFGFVFIALFLTLILRGIRNIGEDGRPEYVQFIWFGLLGYFLTGLFNDSTVATAPMSWYLLGIASSLLIVKKK